VQVCGGLRERDLGLISGVHIADGDDVLGVFTRPEQTGEAGVLVVGPLDR